MDRFSASDIIPDRDSNTGLWAIYAIRIVNNRMGAVIVDQSEADADDDIRQLIADRLNKHFERATDRQIVATLMANKLLEIKAP